MTNALNKMGWLLAALVSLAALAALTGLVSAGPLDPPGPPTTGTMKTLTEVEPRTPISSLPYTISSPGSYYLTGNLTLASGDGITIAADQVILDLTGFRLSCTACGIGDYGISGVTGAYRDLTIRNGALRGWDNGVNVSFVSGGSIEDVTVSNSLQVGMYTGSNSLVEDVVAHDNPNGGIFVMPGSVLRDCTAFNNSGFPGFGVRAAARTVVERCDVYGNTQGITTSFSDSRIRIAGNNASGNLSIGILIMPGSDGNTITDNVVTTNGEQGIHTTPGSDGNTITDNQVTANGHNGIILEGTRNYVAGNTVDGNGTALAASGIYASGTTGNNRIEDNHATNNSGWGIWVDGAGSTIFRNSARANPSGNYIVAATNDLGPTGTAAAATSPWANISN